MVRWCRHSWSSHKAMTLLWMNITHRSQTGFPQTGNEEWLSSKLDQVWLMPSIWFLVMPILFSYFAIPSAAKPQSISFQSHPLHSPAKVQKNIQSQETDKGKSCMWWRTYSKVIAAGCQYRLVSMELLLPGNQSDITKEAILALLIEGGEDRILVWLGLTQSLSCEQLQGTKGTWLWQNMSKLSVILIFSTIFHVTSKAEYNK